MAITFGPMMVFPLSFDRDEPDYTPYDEVDEDPFEGVFPYMDEDGTQVIDPIEAEVLDEFSPMPEEDDEDWVLNLRGGW